MSKDPAFLFYPNDYLGGTMGFSFEQHGAYLMLLIYQFNNGPFSVEKACEIIGPILFESIRHKFDEKKGCICNARLMQEISKRKVFSESRRKNAEKRWNSTKNDASASQVHSICNATAMHMGNENENRNISLSEEKKENKQSLPELYKQFISKCPPYWQVSFEREVYSAFQGLFQTSRALAILAVGLIEKYALYCLRSGKNGQYIGRPEKWFREMKEYGFKYDYEARFQIEKKDTQYKQEVQTQAPKEWKPKEVPEEDMADPEEIKNILESIANKFSAKY